MLSATADTTPQRGATEEVTSMAGRQATRELSRSVTKESMIEAPEIDYVETTVEIPERIVQEKITHMPRVEIREKVVEVPKIITQEKIVEVPEIEYQEILVERIVEVPEYKEETVVKEVSIDEYVEVPVEQVRNVNVEKEFERKFPVPVEVVSEWKFRVPKLTSRYRTERIPIYVPRFIEVPIPSAYLTDEEYAEAEELYAIMRRIANNPSPSVGEIEKFAEIVTERSSLIRKADSPATMQAMEAKLKAHLGSKDAKAILSVGPSC